MRFLWNAVALQARVIGALVIRELQTRYGRENIGFLWVVGEPAIFCVGVAILWTLIRPSHEHGVPVTAFVITGYVPLTMWRHCLGRGVKAFEANGSLMFHRQVTPLDIILARIILEVYGTVIAGLLVSIGAILVGYMESPKDIGMVYLGMAYMIVFCLATALILASLTEMAEVVEKFVAAVSYLSIPFSGAFLMVDWVPQKFQWVVLWSPSVHAIEMLREGQFGRQIHAHYDVVYVSWVCALLILVGLSLSLRSRKYIVVQ